MCTSVAPEQCGWGTRGDAPTWCWNSGGHPRQRARLEDHTSTRQLSQGRRRQQVEEKVSKFKTVLKKLKFLFLCPFAVENVVILFSLWQFYAFSTFAMQLNDLEKSMEGIMPLTDSRLRPDIRAMENGDIGTFLWPLSECMLRHSTLAPLSDFCIYVSQI